MTEQIQIEAKPLMSPQACQFLVSKTISDKRVTLKKKQETYGSSLMEKLFAVEQIEEVLVEGSSITLKKSGNQTWQELGPLIGKAIREGLSSEQAITAELLENFDKPVQLEEGELRGRIEDVQRLLDKQVAPALAQHGGHVKLVKIEGGNVYLSFGGGCQGCAQISVTVKDGIEKILKGELPWMEQITDVTNHEDGDNPYY